MMLKLQYVKNVELYFGILLLPPMGEVGARGQVFRGMMRKGYKMSWFAMFLTLIIGIPAFIYGIIGLIGLSLSLIRGDIETDQIYWFIIPFWMFMYFIFFIIGFFMLKRMIINIYGNDTEIL